MRSSTPASKSDKALSGHVTHSSELRDAQSISESLMSLIHGWAAQLFWYQWYAIPLRTHNKIAILHSTTYKKCDVRLHINDALQVRMAWGLSVSCSSLGDSWGLLQCRCGHFPGGRQGAYRRLFGGVISQNLLDVVKTLYDLSSCPTEGGRNCGGRANITWSGRQTNHMTKQGIQALSP